MHAKRIESQEAGLKYFVLGGFSSAFFLYGIAMTYGATGTTSLIGIKEFLPPTCCWRTGCCSSAGADARGPRLQGGGRPVPHLGPRRLRRLALAGGRLHGLRGQGAALAALIRVFVLTFPPTRATGSRCHRAGRADPVRGAVLAIVQTNVKRMLAYSSIAHAGFILVGVQLATPAGTAAVLLYLAAYTFWWWARSRW